MLNNIITGTKLFCQRQNASMQDTHTENTAGQT